MKKRRKNQRKASSRQCTSKRFMARNAYLQIAYYLRPMIDGILQFFYFRPARNALACEAGGHFSSL